MVKQTTSDKIAKLAKRHEAMQRELEESQNKIQDYENKLAQELGQLALANQLHRLDHENLIQGFQSLAKAHQLL